ncbi:MAG TPA: 4-(cytidine 5'-diphospho)-2-C-methyl-D-erythritol kinase [Jiangellaceae bacterium]
MSVRVPAKINLVLSVGPLRPDGFHDVATLFQAVSLYDEVTASPAADLRVTLSGPHTAGVTSDASNLAARAVVALARRAGREPAVHLHLDKLIPVAGGLAGGSADAAGALLACDRLWGLGLARSDLADVAASLGSDVPFALLGGTAVGTGRGERLRPVSVVRELHWVVAVAAGGLSTPVVFGRLDDLRAAAPDTSVAARAASTAAPDTSSGPVVPQVLLDALRDGDATAIGAQLHNDLQVPALDLRPELATTLAAARRLGALGGVVSGSGPTCVALARDAAHADDLAAGLRREPACVAAHAVVGPAAPLVTPDGAPRSA